MRVTDSEAKRRIEEEPDFANLPAFGYSIARALKRYPNGLPEALIAEGLMMTVSEVRASYDRVAAKLRAAVESGPSTG